MTALAGSNWLPKAGLSQGKQTYRCSECLHRFTPEDNRSYYPKSIKRQAIAIVYRRHGIFRNI